MKTYRFYLNKNEELRIIPKNILHKILYRVLKFNFEIIGNNKTIRYNIPEKEEALE